MIATIAVCKTHLKNSINPLSGNCSRRHNNNLPNSNAITGLYIPACPVKGYLNGCISKLGVQNLLRSQTGSQSKPIRGSVKTYPGPVKTLPGPIKTLPGPIKTLPGQVKTLPGMVKTYPVSVYLASYWFTLIKRLFKSIVQCS